MQSYDMPWAEMKGYRPALTQAHDFDAFWEASVAEARRDPLETGIQEVSTPYPLRAWDLSWAGFGGGRIQGRLMLPAGSGPAPVAVLLHGYDWYRPGLAEMLAWIGAGVGALAVDIRGQDPGSPDTASYPRSGRGWLTEGLLDPHQYYYRRVYLDCLRGLQALREHPGVDGTRLGVAGLSQGGALALALAALDPAIRVAVAGAPFMAHIRRAVELHLDPPYDEVSRWFAVHDPLHRQEEAVYQTLSYFDVMNFAPRIRAPLAVGVGLQDRICPPSTALAVFNHVESPKTLWVFPEAGHSLPPPFWDSALETVTAALTSG
jgi:cephalosporin-C deacetylase